MELEHKLSAARENLLITNDDKKAAEDKLRNATNIMQTDQKECKETIKKQQAAIKEVKSNLDKEQSKRVKAQEKLENVKKELEAVKEQKGALGQKLQDTKTELDKYQWSLSG